MSNRTNLHCPHCQKSSSTSVEVKKGAAFRCPHCKGVFAYQVESEPLLDSLASRGNTPPLQKEVDVFALAVEESLEAASAPTPPPIPQSDPSAHSVDSQTAQRLATLERDLDTLRVQNRKQKRVGVVAASLLALMSLASLGIHLAPDSMVTRIAGSANEGPGNPTSHAEVIQAREFVLLDESGNKRGVWTTDEWSMPELTLYGVDKSLLSLRMHRVEAGGPDDRAGGGYVSIVGAYGKELVNLTGYTETYYEGDSADGTLRLYGMDEQKAYIGTNTLGSSMILSESGGEAVLLASASGESDISDASGSISFSLPKPHCFAQFGISSFQGGYLQLSNNKGEMVHDFTGNTRSKR